MITTTETPTTTPRIYAACLAAYNNGILHGAWIEAAREPWAIWADIARMLAASPIPQAEEWAIHDYEGFEGASLAEYAGVERVAALAAFIVEHGKLGAELLAYFGGDLDEARAAITVRYLGCYASLADYAEEVTEAAQAILDSLRYYIDWEAMARDCVLGGDLFTVETGHEQIHVFAGC